MSRHRHMPPVPTLLLAGDHDLITPLAWTQHEVARAADCGRDMGERRVSSRP